MPRPRHPHKDIEEAVQYAEGLGWRFNKLSGHAWGELLCPIADREGCRLFIYTTPRNPEGAARGYKRVVNRCECSKKEDCNEGA